MDLDIRRIDNTDYDKCLEIARDLKEWFNERGISKMTIDLRVHEAYGAYLNGELVGFVVLRFERSFAEIVWMAVKRKYQGKSIGTRLLNFIEYVVRGRDVKLLIVVDWEGSGLPTVCENQGILREAWLHTHTIGRPIPRLG